MAVFQYSSSAAAARGHAFHAAIRDAAAWVDIRDHRVMQRLNHWRPPRWMRLWMIAATRGGDGWLWYAMGLIVALFGGADRIRPLASAFLAVSLGIAVFLKLKRAIGRRRPCTMEPHCWATLLPPDQFSFPSGHTITAFAVALALGSYYPSMLPGLLFCAASVAASRILLGMHFLTDVLAGAALGAALGELCAFLLRRLTL
jgi:undecaprenyl-diphosphatase